MKVGDALALIREILSDYQFGRISREDVESQLAAVIGQWFESTPSFDF